MSGRIVRGVHAAEAAVAITAGVGKMPRVLYFWGGDEAAKSWGIAHGGEREVLLYGETEQVPRVGDFVFL